MSEQTVTLEDQVRMALARGYCHPENSHKEMDGTLAYAMAEEVMKIMPTLESKPFRPTIKKVVVNPNLSLDIFFNEQELLPINVELELKFQEPQPTKYPFDFAEWMKEKNIHLHSNGKFYADDLVILKDEQVEKLYDDFINRPQKTEWSKEELEKNLNASSIIIAEQQKFINNIHKEVAEILDEFEHNQPKYKLTVLRMSIKKFLEESAK